MSSEKPVLIGASKSSPLFVDPQHFKDLDEIANNFDLEKFGKKLQLVLKLEHATIPPYLTAAYSLAPRNAPSGNLGLRKLMIRAAKEEMLHMTVIANLMNAIGVRPNLKDPEFIPTYPAPLPLLDKEPPFSIGVESFYRDEEKSKRLLKDVFMRIEASENPLHYRVVEKEAGAGPQPKTIGALYEKIIKIIEDAPTDLFKDANKSLCRQLILHSGSGGVNPNFKRLQVEHDEAPRDYGLATGIDLGITDRASAVVHLNWIMEEGEGTKTRPAGSEKLPAHYYRFASAFHGRYLVKSKGDDNDYDEGFAYAGAGLKLNYNEKYIVEFDPSPRLKNYEKISSLYSKMKAFRVMYGKMLGALDKAFNAKTHYIRDDEYAKSILFMSKLKDKASAVRDVVKSRQQLSLKGGLCYGPPT